MKKVLAFDVDQTLNIAKTPIDGEMAKLLAECLKHFYVVPISGQKFEQFLVQIVEPLARAGMDDAQAKNLHLFIAQGTQYYRFARTGEGMVAAPENWEKVYDFPLEKAEVERTKRALEQAARELGFWEEEKLVAGDEIIEDRGSQVTFSALGQKAGTEAKYAWDPDHAKRDAIARRAKELAPEFDYEVAGTTSVNVFRPGTNKEFGMTKMMEALAVGKAEILYFGDMTQPGGNDYPVVRMGIETITVRSHEDTAFALKGILGVV